MEGKKGHRALAPKRSDEQREAIRQRRGPRAFEDDKTRKVYVIIDEDVHLRDMQALEEHAARRAVCAGIADLEGGPVVALAEVDARLRQMLGRSSSGS